MNPQGPQPDIPPLPTNPETNLAGSKQIMDLPEDVALNEISKMATHLQGIVIPEGLALDDARTQEWRSDIKIIRNLLEDASNHPSSLVKEAARTQIEVLRTKRSMLPKEMVTEPVVQESPVAVDPEEEVWRKQAVEKHRASEERKSVEEERGELEAAKIDAGLPVEELKKILPLLRTGLIALKGSADKAISDEARGLEAYINDRVSGVADSPKATPPDVSVEDIILPPEIPQVKTKEENTAALTQIAESVKDLPTTLHGVNERLESSLVSLRAYAGDTTYDESVRVKATEALMSLEVLKEALEHAKNDDSVVDIGGAAQNESLSGGPTSVDINLDDTPIDKKPDEGEPVVDIGIVTPDVNTQQSQPNTSPATQPSPDVPPVTPISKDFGPFTIDAKFSAPPITVTPVLQQESSPQPASNPVTPEASPAKKFFSRILRPLQSAKETIQEGVLEGARKVLRPIFRAKPIKRQPSAPQTLEMIEPTIPTEIDPELLKRGEEAFGTKDNVDTVAPKKEMSPTAFAERKVALSVKLEKMRIARGEKATLLERTGKLRMKIWDGINELGKKYNELPKETKIKIGVGLAAASLITGGTAALAASTVWRAVGSVGTFVTLSEALRLNHETKTGEERTKLRAGLHNAGAFVFAVFVGSGMAVEAAKELFPESLLNTIKETFSEKPEVLPEQKHVNIEDVLKKPDAPTGFKPFDDQVTRNLAEAQALSQTSNDLGAFNEPGVPPQPSAEPLGSWSTSEVPLEGASQSLLLPEYPVQSGDTLYKIIRENFADIKSLPAGQQEAAIENILKQMKGDPSSYGISSGDVNTIIAGKDTINLQKISELLQSPDVINGQGIIEHVKTLNPEAIINNNVTVPPIPGVPLEPITIPDTPPVKTIDLTVPAPTEVPPPSVDQPLPATPTPEGSPDQILEETRATMKARLDGIFGTKDIFGTVQTGGDLSPAWLQIKEKAVGDILAETSPSATTTAVKNMLGNLSLESGLPVVRGEHVADYMERALLKISENRASMVA